MCVSSFWGVFWWLLGCEEATAYFPIERQGTRQDVVDAKKMQGGKKTVWGGANWTRSDFRKMRKGTGMFSFRLSSSSAFLLNGMQAE